MQDATQLFHVNFGDTKDIPVSKLPKLKPTKAKYVNFLDKFADPPSMDADSGWEVKSYFEKNETGYLRGTRNRNCAY